MEKINLPNGGIAYIKTETELQQEIDMHEETILITKILKKLLKTTDSDSDLIQALIDKHEQNRDSKIAEKESRKIKND